MAKNIRWQIPFVSIGGTHYRIDIYDEGTFTPVTLTGGTSPFTTSEDDSDDYFAPIRTQFGTIEVCTLMPDGNYITLDDLLPANNIARPVRLINLENSNAIEWQGFLSCEAYDQDYTGIPQIIQLPVISVLEAMASVEVDQTKLSGLNTVGSTIVKLLEIFIDKAGISYFSRYYVPTAARGSAIIGKYIDATVLFEQKEYNNENSTTYIVSGLSIRDCLERIAVYMGWCVRENNISLFFMAAKETTGYRLWYRQGRITPGGQVIYLWIQDIGRYTQVTTADIANLSWRGTDHKRTVSQGAKSVEVVAKLEKYELKLELPECPVGDTVQYVNTFYYTIDLHRITISSICNKDNLFTNLCEFYCYRMTDTARIGDVTTVNNVIEYSLLNPSTYNYNYSYNDGSMTYFYNPYVGSFMAKIKKDNEEYTDGLYIVGFWEAYRFNPISETNHLFLIRSLSTFDVSSGNLILKCNHTIIYDGDIPCIWGAYKGIDICIKFGDKYWDGSSWNSSFSHFRILGDEVTIPVNTRLRGEVSIRLYGYMNEAVIPLDGEQSWASNMFISELSIDYEPEQYDEYSNRSENHYFRLLGTNFRDEISVNTDLASTLNNQPSPSLIMNSETEAMTELNYGTDQVPDMRRPEVDLLNRLAEYYQAARQRLSLIVAHPTAAPLPLLRLNGISTDNRTYLPLAESRDWREETCTLTCFETPEQPSES